MGGRGGKGGRGGGVGLRQRGSDADAAVVVRWPSYTTEAHATHAFAEAVVAVATVGGGANGETGGGGGGRFAAVSLDARGTAVVWECFELPLTDLSLNPGADPGLRIGSKFRLARATVVTVDALTRGMRSVLPAPHVGTGTWGGGGGRGGSAALRATCMACAGDAMATLALGTDAGVVLKSNRYGARPSAPRYFYRPGLDGYAPDLGGPARDVISCAFCPHGTGRLLCAYGNGTVALFNAKAASLPLATWAFARRVVRVRWCPLDSELFYALDGRSTLHAVWAGAKNSKPVASHALALLEDPHAQAMDFDANEGAAHATEGGGAFRAGAQRAKVFIAVTYTSGRVVVCQLSQETAAMTYKKVLMSPGRR